MLITRADEMKNTYCSEGIFDWQPMNEGVLQPYVGRHSEYADKRETF